jgi:hypothetical protein
MDTAHSLQGAYRGSGGRDSAAQKCLSVLYAWQDRHRSYAVRVLQQEMPGTLGWLYPCDSLYALQVAGGSPVARWQLSLPLLC